MAARRDETVVLGVTFLSGSVTVTSCHVGLVYVLVALARVPEALLTHPAGTTDRQTTREAHLLLVGHRLLQIHAAIRNATHAHIAAS
jgi:hypothetical protein